MTLLTTLSKLHDADISMSHWAVEAFHYEHNCLIEASSGAGLPISVAATPSRARSPSPARNGGETPNVSARREHGKAPNPAVTDRLRGLKLCFTPLDVVRADIVEDETAAFLRTLGSAGEGRSLFRRAVDDGTELIPYYSVTRLTEEDQRVRSKVWEAFFQQFVTFVTMPTTANGESALQQLESFLVKFPSVSMAQTADRLRKAIAIGRVSGTVPITASQIKRARLAATLSGST
jgi:hypothetical protein